jgi:glycosyltransferase involved in cell wall biosynthesis
MLFSILIPTLEDRKIQFLDPLMAMLSLQLVSHQGVVEVCLDSDKGEKTIGEKRNTLLKNAQGKYSAFIDDDDMVSDTYVDDIVHALTYRDDVDCVGFYGHVFFQDEFAGNMIHSTMCLDWTEEAGVYFRPPNHLNPIRRELALQQSFQHIDFSEDHFWSVGLKEQGLLKTEVFLGHKPTYIYKCREKKKGL